MTAQDEEIYLSREEAASFLGVSARTVDRYSKDQRIKRYRRGLGREIFFRKSELEELRETLLKIYPDDEGK